MNNETIILAGGCFWCTEAIFKRLKGVASVTPGYSGGDVENPTYEQVTTGKTGHAESIKIEYDPSQISLKHLLDVFWHTHNPTELNRQGNDLGTQYRSAIFYQNQEQNKVIQESLKVLKESNYYSEPIVTIIEEYKNFYPAEDYHKDYFDNNPNKPYCTYVITPKIAKLMDFYKKDVKQEYLKS